MGNKVTITAGFSLLWALCLLILPVRWAMGALLAALVHELAHCAAVWLFGGQVLSLKLGAQGAILETSPMQPGKEAFCTLAGPLGSFCVLLMGESFPEAGICAFFQGIFNLLPFYPLDGGRILGILFSERICNSAAAFFAVILAGLGIWTATQNREAGIVILLFLIVPLIRGKIACKESKQAVQ